MATYFWTNEAHIADETTPINNKDLNKGMKYIRLFADLPKGKEGVQEVKDTIRVLRSLVRNLKGCRVCYENYVHVYIDGKRCTRYQLLVPNVDSHTIDIYEDLGYDLQRIYKKMTRHTRRKEYNKIKL
jgi:hypothetical protein